LREVRSLIAQINARFQGAADSCADELTALERRGAEGRLSSREEATRLASLYVQAADFLGQLDSDTPREDHTDRFFAEEVLRKPAAAHHARSV
jgi:hypothetical protein